MDVGLNQHFACMFAILVAILVLPGKACHHLFQTELHWTDLSFELGEGGGAQWAKIAIFGSSRHP